MLIPNMEIPKNCEECNIRDIHLCKLWMKMTIKQTYEGKHPDCPLVEVKEPHGRLGDLDKLWDRMYNYIDNEGAKMPFGDNDFMIHKDSACELIEDAPTVIEAEGREE